MIPLKRYSSSAALALIAAAAPIAAEAKSFKEIVDGSIVPFGDTIIALLYAIAFLVFLIGMVRLFFSSNPESREKGKYFAIYGIIGLVVLFAVWGLVRALLGIVGSFNT
jgi:hypothetical protein